MGCCQHKKLFLERQERRAKRLKRRIRQGKRAAKKLNPAKIEPSDVKLI